jgi:hypothetical protein
MERVYRNGEARDNTLEVGEPINVDIKRGEGVVSCLRGWESEGWNECVFEARIY